MSDGALRLSRRVLLWEGIATVTMSGFVALVAPRLLLLDPAVASAATPALFQAILAAGVLGMVRTSLRLRKHRYVLRALALGSGSVEPYDMATLATEPFRMTLDWSIPSIIAACYVITPWRPALLDVSAGLSLALLGSVLIAAASLPLGVLIRSAVLGAVERAPADVMGDLMDDDTRPRERSVAWRLLSAVVTPVVFVAIGSALIVNAHLRRADATAREITARAIARASLERFPGVIDDGGLEGARLKAKSLGFHPRVKTSPATHYQKSRQPGGWLQITTPLNQGSATMRYRGSTVGVVSLDTLLITLLGTALASLLGMLLGRALKSDLQNSTRGVRLLGTDAVLSGRAQLVRPARFRLVASLGRAIARLAERFRVFARAQERAIKAREAAARMRGLFFASVSHDLKSPLNAILGFTELARLEPLSHDQQTSLDIIERRGRELLALIETILDAARVEARQMSVEPTVVDTRVLLEAAMAKARDLGGDVDVQIDLDIRGPSSVWVDAGRMERALATMIGHAIRTAERSAISISVAELEGGSAHIAITIPSDRFSAPRLEAMLQASGQPQADQNRGLALGLSLARAVIDLHRGTVTVHKSGDSETEFHVTLPSGGERAQR